VPQVMDLGPIWLIAKGWKSALLYIFGRRLIVVSAAVPRKPH